MTHRILHIISTLDRGGSQKSLARLAVDFPRDEFDVHVCAIAGGGPYEAELQAAGIPVTALGGRLTFDPFVYWKLRSLIRKLQPDLVQTWNFAANVHGRAAAISGGVKTIVGGEQCVEPWKPWHRVAIDRRLARRSARIVVNSVGVRDDFVGEGIAAEKFTIIPSGISEHEGPPSDDASRATLLGELGLPEDARLIGAVGTLTSRKRLRDPLWAADLLKVIRDDVHFLIIGDGPERASLTRFRDLVEIRDRVHFLGHREDVPRLLSHLDLFWHASGYEGLPYPVMEAMAAALPVVATYIPGNRELIVPEETGYLVPVGARAEFARYANNLLDDAELAQRMGEAGRTKVLAEFPVGKMVAAYATLYRELLGG